MNSSTASEIITPAHERAAHAVIEIGPYDLPEPPGGWVDLFHDDGEAEGEHRSVAAGAAAPRTLPAAAPSTGDRAVPAPSPSPARARGWVLLPETLVVAAFVLLGVAFAAILVLLRGPAVPAAGSSVSAPVAVSDPAPAAAGDRQVRPRMPARSRWGPEPPSASAPDGLHGTPPGTFGPAELVAPLGGGSALDPEAPPSPSLAPFSG